MRAEAFTADTGRDPAAASEHMTSRTSLELHADLCRVVEVEVTPAARRGGGEVRVRRFVTAIPVSAQPGDFSEALLEKADQHPELAIELLLRALGEQPTHAAAHYNLALLYDERHSSSLAYSHYTDFLTYAGPEYRAVVADVKQRAQAIRSASTQQPSR